MTIEELRYFVEAASCGSFSSAAERLHISPQGLSQGVRHLENDLGVALFMRNSSGVTLSAVGREIYSQALAALNALGSIRSLASEASASFPSVLRCALRRSSRIYDVLREALVQSCGELKIEYEFIFYDSVREREKLFHSAGIDVLFGIEALTPDMAGRVSLELFKVFFFPIVNRMTPLASKPLLSWNDLTDMNIVSEDTSTYAIFRAFVAERIPNPHFLPRYNPSYCIETVRADKDAVYFSTDSILKNVSSFDPEIKRVNISDPFFYRFSAFPNRRIASSPAFRTLFRRVGELMRDYSSA